MSQESPESRDRLAGSGNGNGNGWSKTAVTVLLTFISSLLGFISLAQSWQGQITDLKIALEAAQRACAVEKLTIVLDQARVRIEDLEGGPGKSLALDELARTLQSLRDSIKAEAKP